MPFGKHKGTLVTRVPVGYLRWAVGQEAGCPVELPDGTRVPFEAVARAEIARRGDRLQDIEVSGHAIDRLSQRFLKVWEDRRREGEGLYTWAQREALELSRTPLENCKAHTEHTITVHAHGAYWVIQRNLVIPVLLTVK